MCEGVVLLKQWKQGNTLSKIKKIFFFLFLIFFMQNLLVSIHSLICLL